MASLMIPDPILNGLAKIATLPNESFQELHSALETIPLKLRQHRIFEGWPLKLHTLSEEDSKAIRDAITPLYIAIVSAQLPVDTYVEDVTHSLRQARAKEEWAQSEEVFRIFKERLFQLGNLDTSDSMLRSAQQFSLGHD